MPSSITPTSLVFESGGKPVRLDAYLPKAVGEPIDVYVNGQLLARGEAVVLNDRYGIRITELLGPGGRS